MITLHTRNKPIPEAADAGKVCGISAPSGRVALRGRFEVAGLGCFERELHIPLYTESALVQVDEGEELGFGTTGSKYLGCAADCRLDPIACACAERGVYRYYLPIYEKSAFPDSKWKSCGYILTEGGRVEVLSRRSAGAAMLKVLGYIALFAALFAAAYYAVPYIAALL